MYVQDYDERLFFYASTASPSGSRTGAVVPSSAAVNPLRWYVALSAYTKNNQILVCPSDDLPSLEQNQRH